MSNPLTQVTDALWTMLEDNTAFTALVPASNRIKYDNRSPEKQTAQKADYPEVRIRESFGQAQLYQTSNMSSFTKRYDIQIATGEQSLVSVHDVEWEIIRSFADWPTRLEALQWDVDDSYFVKDCRLLQAEQTLDNQAANRRIRGWTTIWVCLVMFAFQTTALQP